MPQIQKIEVDLSKYDEIILCTPVWWYRPSPAIRAFLVQNDLSGKTIKPVATNAGWLGRTFSGIKKLCPNSKVEEGMNIVYDAGDYRTRELITHLNEIDSWIKTL